MQCGEWQLDSADSTWQGSQQQQQQLWQGHHMTSAMQKAVQRRRCGLAQRVVCCGCAWLCFDTLTCCYCCCCLVLSVVLAGQAYGLW